MILGLSGVAAQEFPKEYFRSPLDIPLFLSGNFGELRSGHYHSGIDIKTQGREGFKVFAVADGFVSRIKVSPVGYGNALYITHPNGRTSVYAHLKTFAPGIEKLVRQYQYAQKTFAIDKILPEELLLVKKGEVVALSGNSGSSGGPHLHFEIRETATEMPTNPLLYSFDIQDTVKPVLRKLYVYEFRKGNKRHRREFDLVKENGVYALKNRKLVLITNGYGGFGVDMRDYMNVMPNYYGIYKLRLYVDDVLQHSFTFNKFSFAESRYINAHIDYGLFKTTKRRIHKLFHEPNQKESFCEFANKGIRFSNQQQKVTILVEDAYGNASKLEFLAAAYTPKNASENSVLEQPQMWEYNKPNKVEASGFFADIPANTFYHSLPQTSINQRESTYSPIYGFLNDRIPLHKRITIGVKPTFLPDSLKNKAFLARKDKKGVSFVGKNWKGDFITGRTNTAGDFTVLVDTVPPVITRWKGASFRQTGKLRYRITDKLSGIKSYNGYIDGKWVLFEYDAKRRLLWHTLTEEQIERHKKHTLQLIVKDKCGNKTERKATFSW